MTARWARAAVQVAGLCLLFAGCRWVGARLHLPLPPGLLALVLLLAALLLRGVPESAVAEGADLLLKILGALFVPAGIGLLRQADALRTHGLALAVALLSALLVGQVVAGWVASRWSREPGR